MIKNSNFFILTIFLIIMLDIQIPAKGACVLGRTVTHADTINQTEKKDTLKTFKEDTLKKTPALENLDHVDNMNKSGHSALHEQHFDKILKLDNEVYVCNIKNVNKKDIFFTYPLNTVLHKINKKHVEKIIYADGNEEVLHTAVKNKKPDKSEPVEIEDLRDWERVSHTYKKEDIEGLFETGEVYAMYESPRLKADEPFLEKNALIILKKRAARQGANIVYIHRKKVHMAYGDLPFIELWAKGYSYEKNK